VIEFEHRDDVWLVQMHSGKNRFNRQTVTELNKALDTVEAVDWSRSTGDNGGREVLLK
jgi:hypothetical protein